MFAVALQQQGAEQHIALRKSAAGEAARNREELRASHEKIDMTSLGTVKFQGNDAAWGRIPKRCLSDEPGFGCARLLPARFGVWAQQVHKGYVRDEHGQHKP